MSEKYLHVTMPDGSVWAIPARVIAEDRARFYATEDTRKSRGPEWEKAYNAEVEFALSEDGAYQLLDWAGGDMDWGDVKEHAVKARNPPEPDYQQGWISGTKEIVES